MGERGCEIIQGFVDSCLINACFRRIFICNKYYFHFYRNASEL